MSMLDIVKKFEEADSAADKAAFEAAMKQKIDDDGYQVRDFLYELYVAQKKIAALEVAVAYLTPKIA